MNQLKNLIFKLPGEYHHSLITKFRVEDLGFSRKVEGGNVILLIINIIIIITMAIIVIIKNILLMRGLLNYICLTKA